LQYAAGDYQRQLGTFHLTPRINRKRDCYDNAVAESFLHTLKTEEVGDQVHATREDVRRAVIDYIEMFYNSRRLHSFLGYVCPKDFEKKLSLAMVG
jgi:putative transposase